MRQLAFHLSVGENEHEIQQRHPFLPIYIICSQNSLPSCDFFTLKVLEMNFMTIWMLKWLSVFLIRSFLSCSPMTEKFRIKCLSLLDDLHLKTWPCWNDQQALIHFTHLDDHRSWEKWLSGGKGIDKHWEFNVNMERCFLAEASNRRA